MKYVENIFFMLCYAHFQDYLLSCSAYFFDWRNICRAGSRVAFAGDVRLTIVLDPCIFLIAIYNYYKLQLNKKYCKINSANGAVLNRSRTMQEDRTGAPCVIPVPLMEDLHRLKAREAGFFW